MVQERNGEEEFSTVTTQRHIGIWCNVRHTTLKLVGATLCETPHNATTFLHRVSGSCESLLRRDCVSTDGLGLGFS